jgi:hypothetical protein
MLPPPSPLTIESMLDASIHHYLCNNIDTGDTVNNTMAGKDEENPVANEVEEEEEGAENGVDDEEDDNDEEESGAVVGDASKKKKKKSEP